MIISFPTALYSSILPKDVDDVQNITFTVSSNDPPRSTISTMVLLRSEETRDLPNKVYTQHIRRQSMGELVFSLSSGNQSDSSLGNKLYEPGQVLDFEDSDAPDVNYLEVPNLVEFQQNTNVIDFISLGLDEDEIDVFLNEADEKFDLMVDDLNVIMTEIKNLRSQIEDNQRLINEVIKAQNAALVVFEGVTANDVIEKLNAKKLEFDCSRVVLTNSINLKIIEAKVEYDKLLKVREVVR